MKIYASYEEGNSPDYHRIVNPLKYMEGVELSDFDKSEIVLFNRYPKEPNLISRAKKAGKIIICDIDDYWHLPNWHVLQMYWRSRGITSKIEESLKMADYVTCTSDYLASRVAEFNKNVEVVPNGLPYGEGQFDGVIQEWKGNVKFIGGRTHREDIKMIDRKHVETRRLKVDEYMRLYRGVNICLAPLVNNEFNRCKSNLKLLEAGVNYSACIASNTIPFNNENDNGNFIPCGNNDWLDKIKYMVNNPEFSKEMGFKLGQHVRKHYNLLEINKTRKHIYDFALNK